MNAHVGIGYRRRNQMSNSTKGAKMSKSRLTIAEIEDQSVLELPERHLPAVAVGAGGLVGVGIAVDHTLNDVLDVNVENNQICVNVAAAGAAAGCAR
jgi:hypothetical protein